MAKEAQEGFRKAGTEMSKALHISEVDRQLNTWLRNYDDNQSTFKDLLDLVHNHTQAVLDSLLEKAIIVTNEQKPGGNLFKAIPVEAVREAIQAVRGQHGG